MGERLRKPSFLEQQATTALFTIGILGLTSLALSSEQRKAIRERDSVNGCPSCMFPHPPNDPCGGKRLEVHHIVPQGYGKSIGMTEEQLDQPTNLLLICERAHHTHVHPDMLNAKANYHLNKGSFQEVFNERKHTLAQGEPYWNTIYDDQMKVIAKHQTRLARMRSWVFPKKGGGENK